MPFEAHHLQQMKKDLLWGDVRLLDDFPYKSSKSPDRPRWHAHDYGTGQDLCVETLNALRIIAAYNVRQRYEKLMQPWPEQERVYSI